MVEFIVGGACGGDPLHHGEAIESDTEPGAGLESAKAHRSVPDAAITLALGTLTPSFGLGLCFPLGSSFYPSQTFLISLA